METSLQLSQGALLYGRGCSAGCEDNFACHRLRLLPFLAMLDGVRTLSTILCTPLRIRRWQGLQPVLGVPVRCVLSLLLCTGVPRLLGTVRVDGLLHDVIRSVSARSNSLIRGYTECRGSSCGQMGSSPNSRVARGPEEQRVRYGRVLGKSLPLLSNCQAGCMWGRGPVVTTAST